MANNVGKKFVEHVVYDKFQDLIFNIFSKAGDQILGKGVEYIKSLPFGMGLNDEENYAHAEIYAAQHLGLDKEMIARLDRFLRPLTDAQFHEVRMLIGRRCQSVKVKGPTGGDEQLMVNPDGAAIIKYLANCETPEEFMAALKRWGADKNLIDGMKEKYGKAVDKIKNSPLVQEKVQQTKGWLGDMDNQLNNWADKLHNMNRK